MCRGKVQGCTLVGFGSPYASLVYPCKVSSRHQSLDLCVTACWPALACAAWCAAVTPLRDGVSSFGQVSKQTYRYYKLFAPPGTTSFTVSLSPLSGSPQIYILAEQVSC
jgi:hypothetical protein